MTLRERPPFRGDHVGSLLRPGRLHRARADHAAGRMSEEGLRTVEDGAIRDVVRMQEDLGLPAATDGEFRRASWHMDFIYQLGGITRAKDSLHVKFRNEQGEMDFAPAALRVDGPIRLERPIFTDAFRFLQQTVTSAVPKLTIPSPSMVHYRGGRASIDPAVYPDEERFWADLSAAYAAEVAALAERGDDAEHQHLRNIKQINAAIADRPASMAVTTHMCRGNFRSSWVAEGGYDFVAEALFSELAVDGFFLEYDDARSGGFAPLRFVPPGKRVVLGLVTTKRPQLEDRDVLMRRIEEASRFVPVEQLALSPQCGFSSTVEGNALSLDQQADKLRLVVDVAEEVWG